MKKNIILSIALGLALTSCYDLDREPEGVLSSAAPFKTASEMTSYLNQFYQGGYRGQGFMQGGGGGIAGDDVNSDNMAGTAANSRLCGNTSVNSPAGLGNYNSIRNVNFLLNNLNNCADKGTTAYKQCVGEAYYFRAYYYFGLLRSIGDLAYITEPLEPNQEELAKIPRENRVLVVDKILEDLDEAIANLSERNNSSTFRVHRDVARILKSTVALYEGTWEKYHKAKGDDFASDLATPDKINDYFTQAAAAAKEVMDRGVWRIYNTGKQNEDYRKLFQTQDLSGNPEVLWFVKYDGDEIGNSVNRYLNTGGGGAGLTASLVDDYLTKDGRPFVGAEKANAKKNWGDELLPTVRDPRLAQTCCTPGQILRPDQGGYTLPPLTSPSAYGVTSTGYSLLKHVQIDYKGSLDAEYKGATPAIQYRYADALLNYAEALAELNGAANANKIVDALHPLRERVGMPDVDFDREYNTESDYPFKNLDKYVQAVRRERRVETACEGRRFDDIMRWAAADELIIGQWPCGALFVGSNLETVPANSNLIANGLIFLTGAAGDAERYLVPVNRENYPEGWQFNPKRDYLNPISQSIQNSTNGLWYQNPGWNK